MFSLPGQDQSRAPRRWAVGAALSLLLHVIGVVLVVVAALPRGTVGPGEGRRGTELAPVAGEVVPEQVRVDVVDPATVVIDPATAPELAAEDPQPAPAPLPPRPGRPRATRTPERPGGSPSAPGPGAPGGPPRAVAAVPLGPPDAGAAPPAPPAPPAANERATAADQAARAAYRAQLRRHLHQAWRANEVYQRVDPNGRLAGSLFVTAVKVRLRADGSIERSELGTSSGIPALDEEARTALGRMQRMPPVPPAMLDAQNGWSVLCKFFLDVGMFRFAAEIRRAITERWRPAKAFAMTAEFERQTVVRVLLSRDGRLQSAEVTAGSGLDFLDKNAVSWVEPGLQLPVPPPAFTREPGPAQVFVAFLHQAREVRVLRPREDVEEE